MNFNELYTDLQEDLERYVDSSFQALFEEHYGWIPIAITIIIIFLILFVLFYWATQSTKTEKIEELEKKVIELEAIIKNNKE